jgi:propionate CoA-transferase
LRILSAEQWVAWRAIREIAVDQVVNIGAGLPVLEIPDVLRASGLADSIHLSVEHGSLGGVNLGGQLCQTHWNPTAIVDSNDTFDFYTGGGLDVAFLGMAQVDGAGNVNVAKVGDSVAGVGGFMDIAQSAKKVVFCGTFRQGGLKADVVDGSVQIVEEGRNAKFVESFETISFNADWARETGQEILYVTERAVFRLTDAGLTLTEIAPGIDLDRDIRAQMECSFVVAPNLEPIVVDIPGVSRA